MNRAGNANGGAIGVRSGITAFTEGWVYDKCNIQRYRGPFCKRQHLKNLSHQPV
jgi:hypothetical protein